jgi:hypothetical protein
MGRTSGSPPLNIRSKIELEGMNPFVRVSSARAGRLKRGWRKPMPVLIRINGAPESPWRINMMPKADGSFFLYLHGKVREASGTEVGDRVSVEIAFDEGYRPGPARMPAFLGEALKADPKALAGYRALPPSRKKELVRHFARLRSDAARARNLEAALRVLSGMPGRFMARDWAAGR